jgi:NitT/TauT family transport system substrate-binding protein
MLASGKVQAITGFSFSSYINLASKGVSEDDISLMLMADYGLKLYGNAVIVNTDFAKAKPNIVKKFLSTTIKGMKEMIADPASTIPYVLKYNKIAKAKTETTRLKMAIRDNIVTDAVKANGIGSVDMNRLNESIKQLSETYSFKTKMDGSKVFDDSYLPDSFKRKL